MTRWTIRIALACCVAALAAPPDSRLRRACWTLGCLLCLAHVAAAFHFYHGWSHAAAYAHTARRTAEVLGLDWGGGLYWNYAFTAAWAGDVLWMWLGRRPRWFAVAVQVFLAFMAFNAAVVFEAGPVRWAGLVGAGALAVRWISALRARRPR